jgi:glyoxylase-like metal-dependent hydrolase (beta-lactamase superfamily II)/rhodanese-related sulfurtransferase
MIFRQYFLACLSHASYLIGDESSGRAVVVDPQRDVSGYVADAAGLGLRIERVIETHFHADFLSGHLELAAHTGAAISYGEPARTEFPIEILHDGDRLSLGDVHLEILATPGHTPESISIVVYEHGGDVIPYGVLTGDTLFVGDVGRPDLVSGGDSVDVMARDLYRSVKDKLLSLPDATRVFPAHGAGSSCGKNLSTETQSTIGAQRSDNYALAPMSEDAFVALVSDGQPVTPLYFSYDARRNHELRPLLEEREPPPRLELAAVQTLHESGAIVLDTRAPLDYSVVHLRGSLNVGLQGRFAEFAGDVMRPGQPIVLVCDPGLELEAAIRLGRIGFDRVVGYLADPLQTFADHSDLTEHSSRLSAPELARLLSEQVDPAVVDVRNPGELEAGMIPGATHLPLARLIEHLDDVDPDRPVVFYCASGYRSCIAASVLKAAGHGDVSDLLGGFEAWRQLVR